MSLHFPEFKFVTEGCLQEWKASNSNFKLPEPVPVMRFLYELCWAMVRGDLPFQKCKLALDSANFVDGKKEEMDSILADVIAHMGQDLTMSVEYRNRLTKMAKWFVESSLVPSRLLQERCEEEFLWESELSKMKVQGLKAKEVRINTRLLYQQTKFNLLREESEGYAKLVTLLCQVGADAANQSSSVAIISIIKSLIGHFDLDPNRVFDIVLDCFELYPDNSIVYNLIPIFPKSHAAQILGFKFQYYQRMEVKTPVPSGLYRLAALLVKSEFIDLDSICAHLLPKDEEAFEHYDVLISKRFEEANKIGKINLAATGKDLMDDEKQEDPVDLFTALDMENEAVIEHAALVETNQNFGLLIGFLSIDDWYHAQILFDRLSRLNPVAHIGVCQGLFRAIERSISSVYDTVCQTHLQNIGSSAATVSDITESTPSLPIQTTIELSKDLFQMLVAVGPYLHRDTILLQKVCRVIRAYFFFAKELASNPSAIVSSTSGDLKSKDPHLQAKEARMRVEEALGACLLPSLQLIPANPAVGQEIWEVLSLLPYEARYRLYGEWEKDDEQIPMVLAAKQIAKLDTRRILKRLAKENLKQLGRMVAKLAHSNPMTVLRTIVHQIEAYKDMIAPVVDAFKYLTQLEYDILEYVVIERLAQGGREKLKVDGLNLSDWLQSLASFWGHLCKKYPSMELRGLFQYLVNQLKKGMGIELVLLQELIQQMANVQYTENMTEEQLDAMAGSETLRFQATLFGMTRNNKALSRSTVRLRDSLLPKEDPKLAIPLLLLIAQHRSMIVIHADAPYIKMVSEQFDRCHGTLLQYVEFLLCAITPTSTYAQLVPSLNDLVHKYHLDPEVAFLIYRPVMRLFKCLGGEIFWPLDVVDENFMESEENDCEPSSCRDIVLDLGPDKNPIMWSDLLETVRSMLPIKSWNSLSPDLYATFWGLTLYDLYVPRSRYEAEIAKQHAAIKALEELSDNSSMAITKRKKDKERIQELVDRITSELQKHEQHVASVQHRLSHEKDKWLSSCPDTLKINMEFLQRCIFPRCIFSMPDAVYCAKFVHMLHSLGTPFFNTVNHIDVLICKTLQPMICCCTEYEAGRLGRFLYETLKMAYYWKSDESVYERECGNMPGFAVYYRYPNSQRVTYGQFIRVHWKWSGRMTRLLVQCLESTEYIEIRNGLIVLTKVSGVFPVTRKSGINLEKRVAKIKGDEREDLKVLATGVAAALAARKGSWISEEEFGMGYLEIKRAASPAKQLPVSHHNLPNGSTLGGTLNEMNGSRNSSSVNLGADHAAREQIGRARSTEGIPERPETTAPLKSDFIQQRQRGTLSINGLPSQNTMPSTNQSIMSTKALINLKNIEELTRISSAEPETKSQLKRSAHSSLGKQAKQEVTKEDVKSGKPVGRVSSQLPISSDRNLAHPSEVLQSGSSIAPTATNGNLIQTGKVSASAARTTDNVHSGLPRMDVGSNKPVDNITEISEASKSVSLRTSHSPHVDDSSKQQKRTIPTEEQDRTSKRRKGDTEGKDDSLLETRLPDKAHMLDNERTANDDQYQNRSMDKFSEKSKEKITERYDKDHREKLDRSDMTRGEDIHDKPRDRSIERHHRERSIERLTERVADRGLDRQLDKIKEDKPKPQQNDHPTEKTDERFHGQSLPPPPPLPPSFVPQSVGGSKRDEETDRKSGTGRHFQRPSPRRDEKEWRRAEENISQDDVKRRREDDFRDRKRDERDVTLLKVEDRDREKGSTSKDDVDPAASKRRKLKRDHISEPSGDYSTIVPTSSVTLGMSQPFDARERSDRKAGMIPHRAAYAEEQVLRLHGKEVAGKARREADQLHEKEWEEEKRQRTEAKRKHRK